MFTGRTEAEPETPILWPETLHMVQLSHPYMTTGKTIALTTPIITPAAPTIIAKIKKFFFFFMTLCFLF